MLHLPLIEDKSNPNPGHTAHGGQHQSTSLPSIHNNDSVTVLSAELLNTRPMPKSWTEQRLDSSTNVQEQQSMTKLEWENQIARHILSLFASSKLNKPGQQQDSEALLDFVDIERGPATEKSASRQNSGKKSKVVNKLRESTSQYSLQSQPIQEEYDDDFTDNVTSSNKEITISSKSKKAKKAKKKKSKLSKPSIDDTTITSGKSEQELKDMQYVESVLKKLENDRKRQDADPSDKYRISNTIKTKDGKELVIRGSPRCYPIWFVSTGDVYADWTMLPGGKKFQAHLNTFYERSKFKDYLEILESVLLSLWREMLYGNTEFKMETFGSNVRTDTGQRSRNTSKRNTANNTANTTANNSVLGSGNNSRSGSPTRSVDGNNGMVMSRPGTADTTSSGRKPLKVVFNEIRSSSNNTHNGTASVRSDSSGQGTGSKGGAVGSEENFWQGTDVTHLSPAKDRSDLTVDEMTYEEFLERERLNKIKPSTIFKSPQKLAAEARAAATTAAASSTSASANDKSIAVGASHASGAGGASTRPVSSGVTSLWEQMNNMKLTPEDGDNDDHRAGKMNLRDPEQLMALWKQLIMTCIALSVISIERKLYDQGMELINQAETWSKRNDILHHARTRRELKAYVKDALAYFFFKKMKSQAAIGYAQQAMQLFMSVDNAVGEGVCLLHIAAIHNQQGDFTNAHKSLYEFLAMVEYGRLATENTTPKQLCMVAIAHHNLAVVQLKLLMPDLACKSSQNARKIARLCLSYSNRWVSIFQYTHEIAIADLKYDLAGKFAKDLTAEQIQLIKELSAALFDEPQV